MAERGDEGVGAHGRVVDKTQELAIVTVAGPDGRPVLPAFTSVATMAAWNPAARPVPVEAPRVALAAAGDATELIVIDPTTPTEVAIRRPAFRSLATGEPWRPCFADETVLDAFLRSARSEPAVRAIQLAPGDPEARLTGPELLVQLTLLGGLDAAELAALLARLQDAWARDPLIVDRVDSIGVALERMPGCAAPPRAWSSSTSTARCSGSTGGSASATRRPSRACRHRDRAADPLADPPAVEHPGDDGDRDRDRRPPRRPRGRAGARALVLTRERTAS